MTVVADDDGEKWHWDDVGGTILIMTVSGSVWLWEMSVGLDTRNLAYFSQE